MNIEFSLTALQVMISGASSSVNPWAESRRWWLVAQPLFASPLEVMVHSLTAQCYLVLFAVLFDTCLGLIKVRIRIGAMSAMLNLQVHAVYEI